MEAHVSSGDVLESDVGGDTASDEIRVTRKRRLFEVIRIHVLKCSFGDDTNPNAARHPDVRHTPTSQRLEPRISGSGGRRLIH